MNPTTKQFVNKKASYNYTFLEKFEAGIVLTGSEIKQVRDGRVNLSDAYVIVRDGEAFLVNAHIASYQKSSTKEESTRSRKLLLMRKELDFLVGKTSGTSLTIVPTRLYFRRGYAKIEVALAQGKRKVDKRESIKRKEADREAQKILREDKRQYQDENRK